MVQLTIDHLKASLSLVQPQLEVGSAEPWEVIGAPLDVEDAVGRSARNRRVNAAVSAGINIAASAEIRPQIVPVWEDYVPTREVGGVRQAQAVVGHEVAGDERRCAVR